MTKEEMVSQLEELKKSLEASMQAKADERVKAAEEKLEAVEKAMKSINEKDAIDPDEIKSIRKDLDTTIKAFDLLQTRMKTTAPPAPKQPETFEKALEEALDKAHDDIHKFLRKEKKRFELDLKAVGTMTTANVTGSTTWGAQTRPGIIMNPNTRNHVRDFINVLPAGPGTDLYFMRENGAGEGAIAPVAEGADKPQIDLDLVESSVKFETIAGWLKISRKALNNIPGITAYLQSRLPEKLMDVEDAQILYGTGSTPQIKGILASGNFKASTATAAQVLVEKIITDLSVLEDTYKRKATGILMRPVDYYSLMTNKAIGSGEYDLPQVVSFVNGVLYIAGVPVGTTTALNSKDYIVGDFNAGTDLFVQEGIRIEFFEQDDKNVQQNLVTVRIEETVALPVYGDNFFIKGNSTYTPAE